jgi:hypothetical protein
MQDRNITIFADNRKTPNDPFEERLVNPEGFGLEFDTFVSACEISEQKIFWVIALQQSRRPNHSGISNSYREAEAAVLRVLNNRRALCRSSQFAIDEYIEQKLEENAEGKNGFAEAARLEFIYEKYGPVRYQVYRKSSDEIIIYAEPFSEKFLPSEEPRTFKLDKRALDNTGEAKARGKIFCTEIRKHEIDKYRKIPSYLKFFGLDWDADVSDVKFWFRKLSKEYHPDMGGSPQQFRELTEAYEKAVKALIARDIRDGFIRKP